MSGNSTFGRELARALSPLRAALSSPTSFAQLMSRLGFYVELNDAQMAVLQAVLPVAEELQELADLLADLDAEGDAATGELVEQVALLALQIIEAIEALSSVDASAVASLPEPLNTTDFWLELAGNLPGYLLIHYLRWYQPLAYALLVLVGVILEETRENRIVRRFDWSSIGTLFTDPAGLVADRYRWPSELDHRALFLALAGVARALGADPRVQPVRQPLGAQLSGLAEEDVTTEELAISFFHGSTPGGFVDVGVLLAPVPDPLGDASATSVGMLISGLLFGSGAAEIPLGDDGTWSLAVAGEVDASGTLGPAILPSGVALIAGAPSSSIALELSGQPAKPWRILGLPGGPGFEVGGVKASAEVATNGDEPELILGLRFEADDGAGGLRLTMATADADSFLQDSLEGADSFGVDVGFRWSSKDGFGIDGLPELSVELQLDLQMGPVHVDTVSVALASEVAGSIGIEAAATGTFLLGPFTATVDGIGIAVELASRDEGTQGGIFGPLDASIGFLPPKGLGLALDVAGVASGGGYLYIDSEKGQYAGVADIDLLGVGVTAIGLLATKLPDGSDGWSMFLSLSATFTGLQLGFGFTLNGVGGIIGVNRGLDVEALGDGIRTGALDSILFPDDPVANATRILSDLDAIFPTQVGQYVFGPVAKIGWGTPTIIEADVGIVIQLPDPLTFTLLGSLSAVLPDEEAALLVLNIDVAGTFDATHGTLSIDASLRDSQVVGLSLSGDMAMRASFLDQPSFLLSFGGFNPHFTPPSSFPDLNRLSVSLDTGDSLRLSLWGYFAVTSNTVQFGAGADLWAKAAGLTVEGHFSFDALIQFNPFLFVVDLGFSVEVRAGSVNLFGVYLALMFEGPNPFHVVGTATMKILGIKTTFELDQTIGKKEAEGPRELVYAQALLIAALEDAASWREVPPDADAQAVVLAESSGTEVRVHPAGSLDVIQRVVPLNRKLEKYGAGELGDLSTLSLLSPSIDGDPATSTSELTEWFAPGQFYDLSEDERLSSPSFEEMPGGMRFGDDGVDSGPAQPFTLDYEQIIRDPDIALIGQPTKVFTATAVSLSRSITRSAVARTRRAAGLSTSKTVASPYALGAVTWVVVDDETGAVATDLTPTVDGKGVAWSEARQALVSDSGASAKSLVPAHEIEEAA
jgi:hypothetical protein